MRSDMRTYWRSSDYWRWWWQEVVRGEAKWGLAALGAIVFGILGYVSAERLSPTQQAATFTTERVVTVVRKGSGNVSGPNAQTSLAPAQTMTVLETQPGEIVTVRRDGRTIVIREPGKTVEKTITLPGAVEQRVVTRPQTDTVVRTETAERSTTVTMPGSTETVTREVTVTQTNEAIHRGGHPD